MSRFRSKVRCWFDARRIASGRSWLSRLALIALAAAAAALPVAALAQVDEGEEIICTGGARLWHGTLEETANIDAVPVPESYRRLFYPNDPCGSGLVVATLIDWHRSFGDEASTAAALAFLEKEHARLAGPAGDLDRRILLAGKPARRDVAAAAPLLAKGGAERERAWRRLARSKTIVQLRNLEKSWADHLFLAHLYLRAASAFRSQALLARARSWYEPTQRGAAALMQVRASFGPQGEHLLADVLSDSHGQAKLDEAETAIAVYTALLSRSAGDIAAAAATLQRNSKPIYTAALEQAFGAGDDFCDFDEDGPGQTSSEDCRQHDNLEYEVLAWAPLKAIVDLLQGEASVKPGDRDPLRRLDSLDNAVRLLAASEQRHERPHGGLGYGASRTDERAALLYLIRAEVYERLARAAAAETSQQRYEREDLLRAAFDDLARAETAAPPTASPARFRRIAERFLALDALADSLPPEASDVPRWADPRVKRKAAYYRTVLPRLDDIAAGR
jgi:hypothetical protein